MLAAAWILLFLGTIAAVNVKPGNTRQCENGYLNENNNTTRSFGVDSTVKFISLSISAEQDKTHIEISGICHNIMSNLELQTKTKKYTVYILQPNSEEVTVLSRLLEVRDYVCTRQQPVTNIQIKSGSQVYIECEIFREVISTKQPPPTNTGLNHGPRLSTPTTPATPGEQCAKGVTEGLGAVVAVLALTTLALLLYICYHKHNTNPGLVKPDAVAASSRPKLPPQRPVSVTSHDSENSLYGVYLHR